MNKMEIIGITKSKITPSEIRGLLVEYLEQRTDKKVKTVIFKTDKKRDHEGNHIYNFSGAEVIFHEETLCGKS